MGGMFYMSTAQVIVIGIFFTGVYYFVFFNNGDTLKQSIKEVNTQIQTAENNITKAQKEYKDLQLFKEEIEQQEEFVKAFIDFIPSSLTFTDISELVIEQASSAGININSKRDIQFQRFKDTDYEFLNIKLEITGSFSLLMLFLSKLTEQKRVLVVDEINISTTDNQMVKSQINLIAFRYKKKEEKESS